MIVTGGSSSDGLSSTAGYNGVRGQADSYGGIFYGNANGSYGVYANGQYLGVYGSGDTYGIAALVRAPARTAAARRR